MRGYIVDEQTNIVNECFAVIYAPRRQRTRFPENVVEVVNSPDAALNKADEEQKYYAARVIGPCRSSEGFNIFYLVEWLNDI